VAKRKVNIGGQEFMGEEVEFQPSDGGEKWSVYALLDGTTLKVKAVVADVVRVDGQYAPNGDPIYSINAQLIVSTSAPENLRRK
jgi:hypothetical protein